MTGNCDKDCMSKRKIFFGRFYSELSATLLPFHVETLQDEMPDSSRKGILFWEKEKDENGSLKKTERRKNHKIFGT